MSQFSFKRKERIRKRSDYIKTYKCGRNIETSHYKLNILKNSKNLRRLGISVSKKTGNAVKRNHIKRIIREFFRLNKEIFPKNSDIVITVKPGTADHSYQGISSELNVIFPIDR